MQQPQHFDPMTYGQYPPNFMAYGEPVYHDPYAQQGGPRRVNPPRQSAQNIRYDFDHGEEEGGDGGREQAPDQHHGYPVPQRSQTMPPYFDEHAFYAQQQHQQQQQAQQHQQGRAAPPQPLSLYHPGDSSLAPPMSPATMFRVANDSALGAGVPATPRTVAMQQHMMSLQQRIGHRSGAGMRDDSVLMSPSTQFHPDGSGLGFDHAFLDGALAAAETDRAGSVDLAHQQRSFSADDAAARRPHGWNPQYQVEGNDMFLIPGQPNSTGSGGNGSGQLDPAMGALLNDAGSKSSSGDKQAVGQHGYSAMGEIAAGSSTGDAAKVSGATGSTALFPPAPDAGISFQPDVCAPSRAPWPH
jgi:hypothetical protein